MLGLELNDGDLSDSKSDENVTSVFEELSQRSWMKLTATESLSLCIAQFRRILIPLRAFQLRFFQMFNAVIYEERYGLLQGGGKVSQGEGGQTEDVKHLMEDMWQFVNVSKSAQRVMATMAARNFSDISYLHKEVLPRIREIVDELDFLQGEIKKTLGSTVTDFATTLQTLPKDDRPDFTKFMNTFDKRLSALALGEHDTKPPNLSPMLESSNSPDISMAAHSNIAKSVKQQPHIQRAPPPPPPAASSDIVSRPEARARPMEWGSVKPEQTFPTMPPPPAMCVRAPAVNNHNNGSSVKKADTSSTTMSSPSLVQTALWNPHEVRWLEVPTNSPSSDSPDSSSPDARLFPPSPGDPFIPRRRSADDYEMCFSSSSRPISFPSYPTSDRPPVIPAELYSFSSGARPSQPPVLPPQPTTFPEAYVLPPEQSGGLFYTPSSNPPLFPPSYADMRERSLSTDDFLRLLQDLEGSDQSMQSMFDTAAWGDMVQVTHPLEELLPSIFAGNAPKQT